MQKLTLVTLEVQVCSINGTKIHLSIIFHRWFQMTPLLSESFQILLWKQDSFPGQKIQLKSSLINSYLWVEVNEVPFFSGDPVEPPSIWKPLLYNMASIWFSNIFSRRQNPCQTSLILKKVSLPTLSQLEVVQLVRLLQLSSLQWRRPSVFAVKASQTQLGGAR